VKPTASITQKALYLLVRTGLGLTFLWASWDKIMHPAEFAVIVNNYDILPAAAVNMFALVLPWIELLCGLFLLGGRLVPGAALTIVMLLFTFILATGFSLYKGVDINCGCFSVSPDARGSAVWNLIRNGGLLAAGIWLLTSAQGNPGRPSDSLSDRVIQNAG